MSYKEILELEDFSVGHCGKCGSKVNPVTQITIYEDGRRSKSYYGERCTSCGSDEYCIIEDGDPLNFTPKDTASPFPESEEESNDILKHIIEVKKANAPTLNRNTLDIEAQHAKSLLGSVGESIKKYSFNLNTFSNIDVSYWDKDLIYLHYTFGKRVIPCYLGAHKFDNASMLNL